MFLFVQIFTCWFLIVSLFSVSTFCEYSFDENLLIRPLNRGRVFSTFHFSLSQAEQPYDNNKEKFYSIFPKALLEIINEFNMHEMHLSLTQGTWDYTNWPHSNYHAPLGAELYVWFKDAQANNETTWQSLTHALSGLLCASLNFMGRTNFVQPSFAMRPMGAIPDSCVPSKGKPSPCIRYSILPDEIVCTENLTPWSKLLPCAAKVGLASLLVGTKVYSALYHSLQVHYFHSFSQIHGRRRNLELVLDSVSDISKGSSRLDWSLRSMFGRHLVEMCPIASNTVVTVDTRSNASMTFHLSPNSSSTNGRYVVYDSAFIRNALPFNVLARYMSTRREILPLPTPWLARASSYVSGLGEVHINVVIENGRSHHSMIALHTQVVPWYFTVFFHTLRVVNLRTLTDVDLLSLRFVPGRLRVRPSLLEIAFEIPPNGEFKVSFEVKPMLLRWTEYPPDANHGFYLPPASILLSWKFHDNDSSAVPKDSVVESLPSRLLSQALLIRLPTPDFSMPYNVICLSCTVVAILFGSMSKLTTKSMQVVPETDGFLQKLKSRLRLLKNRCFRAKVDSDKKDS